MSALLPADLEHAQAVRQAFDATLHRWLCAQIRRLLESPAATSPGASQPLHRYALVSAGQCLHHLPESLAATHGLLHECLFLQTSEAESADVGPWLIALPPATDAALQDALAWQAADEALTLLASPLRLPALAAHLRGFLHGTLDNGRADHGIAVLLRYFDPRIGFDAVQHWAPALRDAFLQPLAWWAGWDAAGQPRFLKGRARLSANPPAGRLPLPPTWRKAVDAVGEPQLLAALTAEALEADDPVAAQSLALVHPLTQRRIVREALDFAASAGLSGWTDRSLACRQALLVHARFHAHPAVAAALANRASVQQPGPTPQLHALLASLPPQVAQDWAADRGPMLGRLYEAQAQALDTLPSHFQVA